MSYKIRNSIVLGVLALLVVFIGGYITLFYQPSVIQKNIDEAKKITAQLQDNNELLNTISVMQGKLRETIHRWNNRIKEISESDISSQTYGYLSDIIVESGSQHLKMNLSFGGTKSLGKTGYNTYKISGVSEFPNIMRFIWLLENGRKLYKIFNFIVRSDEISSDTLEYPQILLAYEMELRAYFSSEKSLSAPVMKPDSTPQPILSNPFQPSILKESPANVRKLVDVGELTVKATADSKALVMLQNGKIVTLKVGDEVYLGRVSAVHPGEGSVEFTLNDGGIVSTVRKKIQFEKDNKETER